MQIYSFPTFNLTKILLTAEETGEPYTLNLLDLTQGEHKSEPHVARHPLGKVPAVEVDGKNYFESNAICRFIAERNDYKLYGNSPEQRALINQWADMATLHIGKWLTVMFYERKIKPVFFSGETDLSAVEEAETFLAQQLPPFENQLKQTEFIAGDAYSIADIIAFSYFSTAAHSGVDLSSYPKISQWLENIKARPSYAKAMSHLPGNDIFALLNQQ
ncbi:MAG: glutathione S-transferase family protein [Colwellia sp.]|nr:glutathione S-transferase family protein [Colwellia sp.]